MIPLHSTKFNSKVAATNSENALWQQLYSQIANKNSNSIDGVKIHIDFIKQCLSYTHLSPLTLNEEPTNKNMFQRSLRSKTIAFIIS